MEKDFILSPSLLSADFSKLAEEIVFVENNGGKLKTNFLKSIQIKIGYEFNEAKERSFYFPIR